MAGGACSCYHAPVHNPLAEFPHAQPSGPRADRVRALRGGRTTLCNTRPYPRRPQTTRAAHKPLVRTPSFLLLLACCTPSPAFLHDDGARDTNASPRRRVTTQPPAFLDTHSCPCTVCGVRGPRSQYLLTLAGRMAAPHLSSSNSLPPLAPCLHAEQARLGHVGGSVDAPPPGCTAGGSVRAEVSHTRVREAHDEGGTAPIPFADSESRVMLLQKPLYPPAVQACFPPPPFHVPSSASMSLRAARALMPAVPAGGSSQQATAGGAGSCFALVGTPATSSAAAAPAVASAATMSSRSNTSVYSSGSPTTPYSPASVARDVAAFVGAVAAVVPRIR
ncbi:MAG: hypothetical protein EOO41_02675, partial [Methanobacteriota archaeon]